METRSAHLLYIRLMNSHRIATKTGSTQKTRKHQMVAKYIVFYHCSFFFLKEWVLSVCSCICFSISFPFWYALSFSISQNNWGWKALKQNIYSTPQPRRPRLKAVAGRADCSGLCPVRLWTPPRTETLQPFWTTCTSARSSSQWKRDRGYNSSKYHH